MVQNIVIHVITTIRPDRKTKTLSLFSQVSLWEMIYKMKKCALYLKYNYLTHWAINQKKG